MSSWNVIGTPKVTSSDAIARIKEIAMTNRRMSSIMIFQAITDASDLPDISATTVRRIQSNSMPERFEDVMRKEVTSHPE
jgi:flagellar motor component MotA